jgi:hypothetical protein
MFLGKALFEESLRYFLQSSQILRLANSPDYYVPENFIAKVIEQIGETRYSQILRDLETHQ